MEGKENCSICLSPLIEDNNLKKAECGHVFHENCLHTWITEGVPGKSCPLCRKPVEEGLTAPQTLASGESDLDDDSSPGDPNQAVIIRRVYVYYFRRISSQSSPMTIQSQESSGAVAISPAQPTVSGIEEGMDSVGSDGHHEEVD